MGCSFIGRERGRIGEGHWRSFRKRRWDNDDGAGEENVSSVAQVLEPLRGQKWRSYTGEEREVGERPNKWGPAVRERGKKEEM